MLKIELKELPTILVVLGVIAIGIALLGVNPLDANRPFAGEIRIAFAVMGSALLVVAAFLFVPRGLRQEGAPGEQQVPIATNLSDKSPSTRLELVDLRDALTHMNGNFVRIHESSNSMKIQNIAFDLEMTAPWLTRNLEDHPRLKNVSYRALVISGASKLIEEVTGGESDIRIEYLRTALNRLWDLINQQETALRTRNISIEIRAYDLPPVLHGFMFNDQHLYLGLTHVENGKVKGSAFPYWYLQFDNTRTTEHLFYVYNSWFDYTWVRSYKTLKFTSSEKFLDIKW